MNNTTFKDYPHILTLAIAALMILAGFQNLFAYVRLELNVILCLMIAPMALSVKKPGEYSNRYAWLSLISLVEFHFLSIQVLFLAGIVFALFFLIESRYGKMGWLPMVLLLLLSPMLKFVVKTFTFPIRLELSAISAKMLTKFGRDVTVNGNVFTIDGIAFSVDQACMGLNTFITGLIITTILVSLAEKRAGMASGFLKLSLIYGLSGILLLIANFTRIILLVFFRSMPETLSHELIGLFCLAFYAGFPIYLIINKLYTKQVSKKASPITINKKLNLTLIIPILLAIFALNLNRDAYKKEPFDSKLANLEIPGMSKEVLTTGIVKYQNQESLMYIKPATSFWRADHTPAICWKASGYNFKQIQKMTIGEQKIYTAVLEKEKDYLYTAWWYDNGYVKTISQMDWRMRNLSGEPPFNLVNITAANSNRLLELCTEYLQKSLLSSKSIQTKRSQALLKN